MTPAVVVTLKVVLADGGLLVATTLLLGVTLVEEQAAVRTIVARITRTMALLMGPA